jgi:hypothetical protein
LPQKSEKRNSGVTHKANNTFSAGVFLIPTEEIKNFNLNISGCPRASVPQWRISPEDNTLLQTSITVSVQKGKLDLFRLEHCAV